jgi:hypothetical protein
MAVPKGGYIGEPHRGRYGPVFPKTPACYGFSILASRGASRHYLRWVPFDIGGATYFTYQGIFDTDFDEYTEDAVSLFGATGIDTVFENLEGLSEGLEDERAGLRQVRPRASASELLGVRRASVRQRRGGQEGAGSEGVLQRDARSDAVAAVPNMFELNDIQYIVLARAPAVTGRYEFLSLSRRRRRASVAGGPPAHLPQPPELVRNGAYMAYRRLEEHVGKFRDFLREHGKTPEGEELLAAKLMDRWRSVAPLVRCPDKDDPAMGADPQRNNDFNYKNEDPLGYAVPLGYLHPAGPRAWHIACMATGVSTRRNEPCQLLRDTPPPFAPPRPSAPTSTISRERRSARSRTSCSRRLPTMFCSRS